MNEEEIFAAAIKIADPAERRKFLDQACGADARLRRSLEQLVASHEQAGTFLHQPAAPTVPGFSAPALEGPGDQIGSYRLLQKIGEGGMGVVYLAEQKEPVRRRVAVKIIKPGMDSAQVLARFDSERQALAMMDHPNIARVFDAGTTPAARPYFAMELVKGKPITEYCDEHRLTPLQRLELLEPICYAVQHAHQKGIIHRDLKPSNILIAEYDDLPVPKVIDFGIAKALNQQLTDKTLVTELGQMIGTPEYMSPEQAKLNQLDVDTRSDIYSLGVLLYELLTGSTPIEKERLRSASWEDLPRILQEEPPRPSQRVSSSKLLPSIAALRRTDPRRLTRLVQGELDWIVMMALDKDRNRRYSAANDFALDIRRFLNHEPVLACPPSLSYRMRKFARRHRGALAVTTLGALLTVVSTLAIGVSGWRAIEARNLARHNLDVALRTINSMLTRVGDEKLRNIPYLTGVRRQLLQEAEATVDQLAADNPGDPAVARFVLEARMKTAEIDRQIGNLDEAERKIRNCLQQERKRLQSADDPDAMRLELARMHRALARTLQAKHLQKKARAEFLNALDELQNISTYPVLTDEQRLLQAHTKVDLGRFLANLGQWQEAERQFRSGLQDYQATAGRHEELLEGKVMCLQGLALWNVLQNRWDLAKPDLDQAVSLAKQWLAGDPENPERQHRLAKVLDGVYLWHSTQGKYEEADAALQDVIARQRLIVDRYPLIAEYRRRLAGYLYNYRNFLHMRGRYEECPQWSETLVQEQRRVVKQVSPRAPGASNDTGWREVNESGFVLLGDRPVDVELAVYLAVQAADLARIGRPEAAERAFQEARRLHPTWWVPNSDLAWAYVNAVDPQNRDPERAVELIDQALSNGLTGDMPWMARGVAYFQLERWEEAIADLDRAAELRRSSNFAPDEPHFWKAMAYLRSGQRELAEAAYQQAQSLVDERLVSAEIQAVRQRAEELFDGAAGPSP